MNQLYLSKKELDSLVKVLTHLEEQHKNFFTNDMETEIFQIFVKLDIPKPTWDFYKIVYSEAEKNYYLETLVDRYEYIIDVKSEKFKKDQ